MERNEYLKLASSKELAARVVAFRLLKVSKDLAIACMEELALRSQNGDPFDYKEYIKTELSNSPKPYLDKHFKAEYASLFNGEK